jgi:hypothetical protein
MSTYGDAIYTDRATIIGRAKKAAHDAWRKELDRRLSSLRIKIEHFFADFTGLIGIFHRSSTLHLYDEGPRVLQLGMIGFLFLNIKTCLSGNNVSKRFNVCPPTIEQYLPLHVDFSQQDTQQPEDDNVWSPEAEFSEEEE